MKRAILVLLLFLSTAAVASDRSIYDDGPELWRSDYRRAQTRAHAGSAVCMTVSVLSVVTVLGDPPGGYGSVGLLGAGVLLVPACSTMLHGGGLGARRILSQRHGRQTRAKPSLAVGLSTFGAVALASGGALGIVSYDLAPVAAGLALAGSGALLGGTVLGMTQIRRNRLQYADIDAVQISVAPVVRRDQWGMQLALRF